MKHIKSYSSITERLIIRKDDAGRSDSKRSKAKNDCAIRSTSLAFDIDYDIVYDYFKEIGNIRNGFSDSEVISVWKKLGKKYKKIPCKSEMTLSDFIKMYPTGSYVLSYRNHITNVIDGILYEIDKPREYFQKEFIHCIYQII